MDFTFSKISSSGNDFIVIDNRKNIFSGKENRLFYNICQRRTGIGADGLILLENSDRCDYLYRYFNSDGYESTMCGNGGRAIAAFALTKGIAGTEQTVEVSDGIHKAFVEKNEAAFEVFSHSDKIKNITVNAGGKKYGGMFLNTGVPHFVLLIPSADEINVNSDGRSISRNKKFLPDGTNVNFVEVIDNSGIKIRTYERGVEDETLACGTGIVASAIALNISEKTKFPVEFYARGGLLRVETSPGGYLLKGRTDIVYEGIKTDIDRIKL